MSAYHDNVEPIRPLPQAIDAEQSVLGCLMADPKSIAKIADFLTADDFVRADHRLIFKAVTGLHEKGGVVDPLTMTEWFEANGFGDQVERGYPLYLNETSASAASIVQHAEIVVERSRLRAAMDVGQRLMTAAQAPGADSQAIIGQAAHDLTSMQASKLRGGLEPAKIGLGRLHVEIARRYENGSQLLGQAWPWLKVNECTKGMRDGILYVVGARPNMGKSVFGLQAAVFNALRGNRSALFSVEMTADECMGRAIASVARIPHDYVEDPGARKDMETEGYWPKISTATARISESPLLIDETPGINIDQLMARARRAHMQKPLRLIVIDHMHDMGLDAKREVRHEYGRIAQGAKTLAKELKCPVILLAQLNRALATRADKRPTMTDLRESGEIEQKADVIFFLHRDDYYDKQSARRGRVDLILAKGRNIKTGEDVELINRFEQMRLDDYDPNTWDPSWEPVVEPVVQYKPRGFSARGKS